MIHVALFSFQRTTLSFEVCFELSFESRSLQVTFISYRIERSLSRSFFFLFSSSFGFLQIPCQSRLLGFLLRPYRSATYTILQDSGRVVNSFFEKSSKRC
ncbi:hypothetical protein, partial [Mitsuokella multacida]|uniref:hypothetical protein n=1 Tax=Mitsuokella multacida TaxID=52226 RepID=UPI0026DF59CF